MKTVLVISAVESTRQAWCLALRRRGMICRRADALFAVLDELQENNLAGIVFDAADDADLATLAALSLAVPLPPVVVVPAACATATVVTRMMAGTLVVPGASIDHIMARLECLVRGRPLSSPTNLPVRLSSSADAQWTKRLSAAPYYPHDEESFDGATDPDGFDIAARA